MLPYYMVRAPPLSLGAATETLLVVENPTAAMLGGVPNLISAKTSILLEHGRRKELGAFEKTPLLPKFVLAVTYEFMWQLKF